MYSFILKTILDKDFIQTMTEKMLLIEFLLNKIKNKVNAHEENDGFLKLTESEKNETSNQLNFLEINHLNLKQLSSISKDKEISSKTDINSNCLFKLIEIFRESPRSMTINDHSLDKEILLEL